MIRLMKNTFYNEELTKKKLCKFIMNSEKLSMGNKCKEFEEEFSKYQGRTYSVLFNSGSSANLALIQSLVNLGFLKKGDRIGFSSLTWATNVMPLIQMGLKPIPIDVSLDTLNIDSKFINHKKLKAIFLTNLLGFCGDMEKIRKACDERNTFLIEDNCESLGSVYKNTKLGNFGLASTFSFFVGHHLSCIEGGMVCTNSPKLYEMLLMVRSHGWARSLDEKRRKQLKEENHINDFYENYTFYSLGYNLRPTEITGFIGLEQMQYLNEILMKRSKNYHRYEQAIKNNHKVRKLKINMDFVSNFAYPLIFKNKKSFEEYKKKFDGKVEIRPIVGGSMNEQPFFKKNNYNCPNAKHIHSLGFYIPNNPDLTTKEINEICKLLK